MTESAPFMRVYLTPAQSRHLNPAITKAESVGDLRASRPHSGRVLMFHDYEGVQATLNRFRAAQLLAQKRTKARAIANAIETIEACCRDATAANKQAARGEALSVLLGAKI